MSKGEHFDESPSESPTWFSWALLVVFALIGVVAVVGVGVALAKLDLSDPNIARSVITVVFTIGTMAIAIILVLAVLLQSGRNVQPRFTSAKEVLTILIGILGTIVGFYFGQATQAPIQPDERAELRTDGTPDAAESVSPEIILPTTDNPPAVPANVPAPVDAVPTVLELRGGD